MIIPTKHQNISYNPLVLGADILFILRAGELTTEELYQNLKKNTNIDLDIFYDTLTYLWLIESVTIQSNKITKLTNVSQ
ncbi:ABC-three component system middle component 6 [Winogradskyella pacifica]|uniref:ABC-three component system middle component 6 n=1 Tax=Winogradskyella pacifica TaxID=664642 RepID=UPI0015C6CBAA|nr:ABC-three component system middle component 6 [Winogradskyella pacifica]